MINNKKDKKKKEKKDLIEDLVKIICLKCRKKIDFHHINNKEFDYIRTNKKVKKIFLYIDKKFTEKHDSFVARVISVYILNKRKQFSFIKDNTISTIIFCQKCDVKENEFLKIFFKEFNIQTSNLFDQLDSLFLFDNNDYFKQQINETFSKIANLNISNMDKNKISSSFLENGKFVLNSLVNNLNLKLTKKKIVKLDSKEKFIKKEKEKEEKDFIFLLKEKLKKLSLKDLKKELDFKIIGQNIGKQDLLSSILKHYVRIAYNLSEVSLKSNVLILGPTGSGKTMTLDSISKLLEVPIIHLNASGLTKKGYIGSDMESSLFHLLEKTNFNRLKAENAIVHIDEIDKIAFSGNKSSNRQNINSIGVQQDLLPIIEGTNVNLLVSNMFTQNPLYIHETVMNIKNAKISNLVTNNDIYKLLKNFNTKNILFIVSGAFMDIEEIIKIRLSKQFNVGFTSNMIMKRNLSNIKKDCIFEDIIKYGFLEEFVGRFFILILFKKLNESELRKIILTSENSIQNNMKIFLNKLNYGNISLKIKTSAIDHVVKIVHNGLVGVRGLFQMFEMLLLKIITKINYYFFEFKKNISEISIFEKKNLLDFNFK